MMKPILLYTLFTVFSIFIGTVSIGQGCHVEGTVIINEIGNFNGNEEYVELLVIGSSANPTAPVNLEGYIIDDNNFAEKNVGNEPGYLRLGSCFASVLPGTLILIYDGTSSAINSNNDGISDHYIQTQGVCLKFCDFQWQPTDYDNCPTQTSDNIRRYIPMRNWGDVLQVRNPQGELVHAISWVKDYEYNDDASTIFIRTGNEGFTLANTCVRFKTGKDWYNKGNYEISPPADKTPGQANSAENADFISRVKSGILEREIKVSYVIKKQPTSSTSFDGEIELKIENGTPPFLISVHGQTSHLAVESKMYHSGKIMFDRLNTNNFLIIVSDGDISGSCGALLKDIQLAKANEICNSGDCIELNANTIGLCNFSWNHNGSPNALQTVCPEETTTYKFTGTDENGNIVEQNFTVAVKEVKIEPNQVLVCPGTTSAILTCEGTYSTYLWSTGAQTPTITVSEAGEYKITATDNSGCTAKGLVNVYNAENAEHTKAFFEKHFFQVRNNVQIENVPGKPGKIKRDEENRMPTGTCFNNYANSIIFDLELQGFVNYSAMLQEICSHGHEEYDRVFITENENFCINGPLAEVDFNNTSLKVFWVHLYKTEQESILFFSENNTQDPNNPPTGYEPMPMYLYDREFTSKYLLDCQPWGSMWEFIRGISFEKTFHKFAESNYGTLYEPNYSHKLCLKNHIDCNQTLLPMAINIAIPPRVKPSIPDGIFNGNLFKSDNIGEMWFEVKLLSEARDLTLGYNDYQNLSHMLNLRCLRTEYIGGIDPKADFSIVTSANLGFSLAFFTETYGLDPPMIHLIADSPTQVDNPLRINFHIIRAAYKYINGEINVYFYYDCGYWKRWWFTSEGHGHKEFFSAIKLPANFQSVKIQCHNN